MACLSSWWRVWLLSLRGGFATILSCAHPTHRPQGVFEHLAEKGQQAPAPVGLQIMVHGTVPTGEACFVPRSHAIHPASGCILHHPKPQLSP